MRISDWSSDVCSSDLRLHLLMGAFAYLTSPLWALLIGVSLVQAGLAGGGEISAVLGAMSGWLFLLTTALLFEPELMSLAWTLIDRDRRAEFGGKRKLATIVLPDIPLAALMAPAMTVPQLWHLFGLHSGTHTYRRTRKRNVWIRV